MLIKCKGHVLYKNFISTYKWSSVENLVTSAKCAHQNPQNSRLLVVEEIVCFDNARSDE